MNSMQPSLCSLWLNANRRRGLGRTVMMLALAVMASAQPQDQEKLSDRVFTVKDKSGAPLLKITNVHHLGSFVTVTVTNVSGRHLWMNRKDSLFVTYENGTLVTDHDGRTLGLSQQKVAMDMCADNVCDIPEGWTKAVDATKIIPKRMDTVDFMVSETAIEDQKSRDERLAALALVKAKAEAQAREARAIRDAQRKKEEAEEERQAKIDAKRQAAANAAAAKQRAADAEAMAIKRAQAKAACAVIYTKTIDRKTSDLTVRETEQIKACQMLGFYHN
jgi:hypothetical protein